MQQVLANDQPSTVNIRHPPDKIRKPLSPQGRYNVVACHKVSSEFEMWRHLPLFFRFVKIVDNDYQRNYDDFKTTGDGYARHGPRQRNEGCGLRRNLNGIAYRRILLPPPYFNMLTICRWTRLIISPFAVARGFVSDNSRCWCKEP